MINLGDSVSLSVIEIAIAKKLGAQRYETNRANGIKNIKVGNQSNEFTDINGMAGEIAFGKLFNLYPDFETDHHPIQDFIYKEKSLDVKTTHYENGNLIAPISKSKDKQCELYALMIGNYKEFPEFYFKGFAKKEELFRESSIKDLGHGPTYGLGQRQLYLLDSPVLTF